LSHSTASGSFVDAWICQSARDARRYRAHPDRSLEPMPRLVAIDPARALLELIQRPARGRV